jgi:large subunit ribosomal protein L15
MRLNELRDNPGARRKQKRLGRGIGSGKGKTSGKGHKGQKARTGVAVRDFEGGQMPLYRRLPKRGFKSPARRVYDPINLDRIESAIERKRLDPKAPITDAALKAAGLAGRTGSVGVRLLARGELRSKLSFDVTSASKAAISAVEKAGGSIKIVLREKKKRLRGSQKKPKDGKKGKTAPAAQADTGAA